MSTTETEILKAALSLGVAVVTLALGWFIGQRLTVQWNLRQKHREHDLASGQEFYRLYGEFFAIWKIWNEFKDNPSGVTGLTRKDIFLRACAAEGGMESLLVRLATNRLLSNEKIEVLGKFRQAYQSLRETIRDDQPLNWNRSNHEQYRAFKVLSAEVSAMILSGSNFNKDLKAKANNLLRITSNEFEDRWYGDA